MLVAMTGRPTTRPRVRRLPLGVALRWSIGISALATVLVVALLWVQMALGNDPALGPKLDRQRRAASPTPAPAVQQTVVPVAPQPAPAPAPVQTSTS
ncbi:MAG: hypothetical protein QOI10_2518 [Solirubrobacterales bacterium]|jgi:hypothetical protein|nr:hypothetical protein [Solirubrobacterales bacterium]